MLSSCLDDDRKGEQFPRYLLPDIVPVEIRDGSKHAHQILSQIGPLFLLIRQTTICI